MGQKQCKKLYRNVIRMDDGGRHYITEVQTTLALDSAISLVKTAEGPVV
jgi:hypothetical protein